MFEDIIGEIGEEKNEDTVGVQPGDGIANCPKCGSYSITKGAPVYLIQGGTTARYECKNCKALWSLLYNPSVKQYKFELHQRK